jgi:hypothetical protein
MSIPYFYFSSTITTSLSPSSLVILVPVMCYLMYLYFTVSINCMEAELDSITLSLRHI